MTKPERIEGGPEVIKTFLDREPDPTLQPLFRITYGMLHWQFPH